MITAQEAIALTNNAKANYRKQERIILEDAITAKIIQTAEEDRKYTCDIEVANIDKDYIISCLCKKDFQIGTVVPIDDQNTKIQVMWLPELTPKKKTLKDIAKKLNGRTIRDINEGGILNGIEFRTNET